MTKAMSGNPHATRTELADLHLCNNYRHLLMALASIAASDKLATVVYLEDDIALQPDLRRRLEVACPQARILCTRDQDQIKAFARLPHFLPSIVRRNISLGGRFGLTRPQHWHPDLLLGQRFAIGYLYHSGFFMSKVVAGQCAKVVLRESGLNNYITLRVPFGKSLLRLAVGLHPFRQVWGEEPWVDVVEVSRPEALPDSLQSKARKLTFESLMRALPPETATRIAAAFLDDGQRFDPPARSALVLTQPLDRIGLCSIDEQKAIYSDIITRLQRAEYTVYVKPHPLDQLTDFSGVRLMPGSFPAEAIPFVTNGKFSLAIALCSASLSEETSEFAGRAVQILPLEDFNAQGVSRWPQAIDHAMKPLT